jgi:hypothetical protein
MTLASEPTPQQLDEMLAPLQAAVQKWFSHSNDQASTAGQSYISQDVHQTWVKANYITAEGLQRDSQTHVLDVPSIDGGCPSVPFYQTWATTFRTSLKRGRGHSGRIYPPCISIPIERGTGLGDVNSLNRYTDSVLNLLADINRTIGGGGAGPGRVSILSPGNVEKGTQPLAEPVTGVVVDRVPDTQHRRTNRLKRAELAAGTLPA